MSDFDNHGEIKHYPGYLYGIRSFAVKRNTGVVISPQQPYTWDVESNNRSHCQRVDYLKSKGRIWIDPNHEHPPGEKMQACFCGFYAYFHPDHAYQFFPSGNDPGVLGIVKAHGRIVVGDAGFRATNAQIVAFIRERHLKQELSNSGVTKYITKLRRLLVFQIMTLVIAFSVGIIGIIGSFSALLWGISISLLTMMFVSNFIARRYRAKFMEELEEYNTTLRQATIGNLSRHVAFANYIDKHTEAILRKKYPDIPFYDSIHQALKDFPLTRLDVEEERESI